MNERVVVELTVDARGATTGTAEFDRALAKAEKTVARVKEKTADLRLDANLPKSVDQVSRAFERLRGSIDPVVRAQQMAEREMVRSMATVDRAVMMGVTTQQQAAATISALRQKQVSDLGRVKQAQELANRANAATRIGSGSNFNTSNIAAQFQDIGVTSAMGMSPVQIALQQGTQLSMVFEQLKQSGQGVGSALVGAFSSIISPISLVTIGVVAATAALIQWATSGGEAVKTVDDAFKQHEDTLARIDARYTGFSASISKYRESAALLGADARDSLTVMEAASRKASSDFLGELGNQTFNRGGEGMFIVNGEMKEFEAAIQSLRSGIKEGSPDFAVFQRQIEAIVSTDPLGLRKVGDEVLLAGKEAFRAAAGLTSAREAVDGLDKAASSAQSSLFKMSEGMKTASRGAYDMSLGGISTTGRNAGKRVKFIPEGMAEDDMPETRVYDYQRAVESATAASQRQLQVFVDVNTELRNTKIALAGVQGALSSAASAGSIGDFFGDVSNIKGAQAALGATVTTIDKLFDAFREGSVYPDQVADAIERLKDALIQGGLGVDSVNKFIDAIVEAEMQVGTLTDRVGVLDKSIQGIRNRTITIDYVVRTTTGGDASIGVTRGYSGPGGLLQPGYSGPDIFNEYVVGDVPTNVSNFATGGFTGHMPTDQVAGFVHGKEFVFDAATTAKIGVGNLESIRAGVRGYETGGAVGSVGGKSVLGMIEENTFQTVEQITRSVGYLSTMETDGQTAISLLRQIEAAIKTSQINVGSSGGSGGFSTGGSSTGSGGWGVGVNSARDRSSPYYYGGAIDAGTGGFDWNSYQNSRNSPVAPFQMHGPYYAKGGIADRPSIFGEAGPEAAVPLPDGRSIPVKIEGGGSKSITVNAHYHAAPGNPNPNAKSLMEMRDTVRRTVQQAVGDL
jgi:hypothetical protein